MLDLMAVPGSSIVPTEFGVGPVLEQNYFALTPSGARTGAAFPISQISFGQDRGRAASSVPGLRGMGDGGLVGELFSFIPQTFQAVGQNLPNIMASVGNKAAQRLVGQQAALQQQALATQQQAIQAQSAATSAAAWAPWVGIGILGVGLAGVVAYAASRQRAA